MASKKDFELIRETTTGISTETLKDDSEIPIKFLMFKDWACLDGESEEHIDFKLPREIHILDEKVEKYIFIHRTTRIEKTRIKTKDGYVEVHTMNLKDEEIVKLIRGFVREAYENEQADSTKEDYWESIEEKTNVVSNFLLNTYAIEYRQSDEKQCIDAMKKQFGDKYCIKSRSGMGYPSTQEVTDLAQKKPHLLVINKRKTTVLPISKEKKADYSKGIWDFLDYVDIDFDVKMRAVNQIVFLQPKK